MKEKSKRKSNSQIERNKLYTQGLNLSEKEHHRAMAELAKKKQQTKAP